MVKILIDWQSIWLWLNQYNLSHYVGGGIDAVLDLYEDEFFIYLNAALEFYKVEIEDR